MPNPDHLNFALRGILNPGHYVPRRELRVPVPCLMENLRWTEQAPDGRMLHDPTIAR